MKIGEIEKNSQEVIRVTLQQYQGTDVIDLRTYWQNDDGDWLPTKKGISLTAYVIEDVIKLLQKAYEKMPEPTEPVQKANPDLKELMKMLKRL